MVKKTILFVVVFAILLGAFPLVNGLSACGPLNTPGVYTLTQDVSSTSTCFTVGAAGVILNCAGYFINYSTDGSSGSAFYSSGFSDATIKNCRIYEGSPITTSSHAVYFNNVLNGLVENNTIITLGNSSSGILLNSGSNYAVIIENNVTANGDSVGIRLITSSDSILFNNTVTTIATEASGIALQSNSNRNLLNSNIIKTEGSKSYSIWLRLTPNATTLLNNDLSASNAVEIQDTTTGSFINFLIYNNSYGEIKWTDLNHISFLKNLTTEGNIGLGKNIFINKNIAALNISAFGNNAGINSSAEITLRSLNITFLEQIKRLESYSSNSNEVLNIGFDCLGISCDIIESTNNLIKFNTTHFSSFAAKILWEVDVYNTSLVYTNSSHYSAFRFFMKNLVSYSNLFNWVFDTGNGLIIPSTLSTNLTANESVFVFVENTYQNGGIYNVEVNGTTPNDKDTEKLSVAIP